jgi:hypothetical protein
MNGQILLITLPFLEALLAGPNETLSSPFSTFFMKISQIVILNNRARWLDAYSFDV